MLAQLQILVPNVANTALFVYIPPCGAGFPLQPLHDIFRKSSAAECANAAAVGVTHMSFWSLSSIVGHPPSYLPYLTVPNI